MIRLNPFHLILLSAALLSAGCASNNPAPTAIVGEPNVPQMVLQAETPAAPTQAPSPVPPTSAVDPALLLQVADRHLLNGFYESAVLAYQSVLSQGAPAELRAAAAFGMGQSALREGLFTDAVGALTTFINDYPNDARMPQARFLRGDAYLGLSRWNEAIADFQAYLAARPGLIDSYAHERIGDAQLALGQVDAAFASYQTATDANRVLLQQLRLREKVAQVYLDAGRTAEAVAQYDAILAVAQNAPYRATIEFAAANALLDASSAESQAEGLARLQRVFNDYPDRPEAYQAIAILEENGRPADLLARGRVSFFYGDYEGAVEAFNTFTSSRPLTEVPAELHLLLGRAYRELGSTEAAVTAFQTIIDQYPTDPLFGTALLEQGRTRFLNDDIEGAIAQYLRIADTYDYLPEAAEALWRAGYLYGTNDQPAESRRIFERLADQYPDSEQAREGLFLAASAAYTTGDFLGAERFYTELARQTTGDEQASAQMWVARLALRRGDNALANQAFQATVQAAPDSYFGTRARDIIEGRAAFAPPAGVTFQFDDAAQIAEAENWLRTTFSVTQDGPLWPLSPELEADPRLVRGRELWTVAAYDEARAEFSDIIEANLENPLASYQLAIFLRGLAAYQNSIVAAANVIRAAGVGTLDAPPYIARMRYPAYYLDVVLESAQRHNVDALLLLSLIRHESLFDTNATAAAGEKGLTQVIPSTGEYIANELRWPDYQHSVLFRPYAGVEFGAFYLSEQLQLFNGNATAALSAYNAGPGRGLSWLELSGGDEAPFDHDLFVSVITIDSTRTYVQRIYSFYSIYRALYGTT